MKISGKDPSVSLENYLKQIRGSQAGGQKQAESATGKPAGQVLGEDKVVLSSKSKQMAGASKVSAPAPGENTQKVSRLRLQVANGTYQVDGQKVASKMIEEALLNELL